MSRMNLLQNLQRGQICLQQVHYHMQARIQIESQSPRKRVGGRNGNGEKILERPTFQRNCNNWGKLKINDSFIGTRIEHLSEFDMVGEVNMKELRWCRGVVKKISDGTWLNPGKCRQCYKENEASFVFGVQFLRQTTPHHVQLSFSMKRSGIIIVMDHVESN